MSFLRAPFLFLSQNTSAPLSGSIISFLYPTLFKGGSVVKPQQPSRSAKQNYAGMLVEYDCKGALGKQGDLLDCQEKARADIASILSNSDDQTFIYVKNSKLLGALHGVPRRMRGQIYSDNTKPGASLGFAIIILSCIALGYKAAPVFQEFGLIPAILSLASAVLIFLVPIVALKGVEDRIVEAQQHQTELDFSLHAARIDQSLDRLEDLTLNYVGKHSMVEASPAEAERAHLANSNFVERMQTKLFDSANDLHQVSLLAPNNICSERASRLRARIKYLKQEVETL